MNLFEALLSHSAPQHSSGVSCINSILQKQTGSGKINMSKISYSRYRRQDASIGPSDFKCKLLTWHPEIFILGLPLSRQFPNESSFPVKQRSHLNVSWKYQAQFVSMTFLMLFLLQTSSPPFFHSSKNYPNTKHFLQASILDWSSEAFLNQPNSIVVSLS